MTSVIITTYNRNNYLKLCLESICCQTIKDIEIIIIDDASIQNVREVLADFEQFNIKYYKMVENSANFSKLKNLGLKYSTGELVAFCDDDDIWFCNKLEKQLEYINNYDFICCNANVIDENGLVLREHFFNEDTQNSVITLDKLLHKNRILFSTVLFKRSILKDIHFLDENIRNMNEDWEFYLRISQNVNMFYLGENLASIRKHKSFSYIGENALKMVLSNVELLRKYRKVVNPKYRFYSRLGIAGSLFLACKLYLTKRKYFQCLKTLLLGVAEFCSMRLILYYIFRRLNRIKIFDLTRLRPSSYDE